VVNGKRGKTIIRRGKGARGAIVLTEVSVVDTPTVQLHGATAKLQCNEFEQHASKLHRGSTILLTE